MGSITMIKRAIYFLLIVISVPSVASDFGVTGLIDIPTARMSPDGNLRTTISSQESHKSAAITYQVTPWLEGTFRYTGFKSSRYTYDRNYEVKALLWEENESLPQVAVGIRDLVGTGFWGSEYIVASKQMGNFDFTLGMGWGRLAGDGDINNPLVHFSENFAKRVVSGKVGGEINTNVFFSGERAGFFGGLNYKPTSLPLSFILEYNPDQYTREVGQGAEEPKSPISAAVKWELSPDASLTFARKHQQEWGINLSSNFDTKALPIKPVKPVFISSANIPKNDLPSHLNKNQWYDMLLYDVERAGILLLEAGVDDQTKTATIVMGNKSYMVWADALANMIDLADLHLPPNIETLNIVIEDFGHQLHTIRVDRSSKNYDQSRAMLAQKIEITPINPSRDIQHKTSFVTNKVFYNYNLAFRTQLFDPDDPLRYQLFAKLGMSIQLDNDWLLRGMYAQNITHNFDESGRPASSVLPHVRTDIVKYLQEGESGLDSFFLEKRGNLSHDIYYRMFGGILETMYSGVGGEVVYHPFQSRFAYGLSANFVRQRDYDRSFSHLEYDTATGFASIYYASPFYNIDLALHAGKYLAKDVGATLELRRTFNNGWMVGLWATKTNVSAQDFGEGSFDKGMYFSIPFSEIMRSDRRDTLRLGIRPIQRDGGQRLEDFSGNIWWDTRNASYDAFIKNTSRKFFAGFSTKKKSNTKQNLFKKYYKEK